MMLKALWSFENGGRSGEERVRGRMRVSALVMVAGFLACVLSLAFGSSIVSPFLRGFYVGTGSGLFGAGLVLLLANRRLLRDGERLKRRMVEEDDERNRFIALKASGVSFYLCGFLLYLGILASGFLSLVVFKTLVAVLLAMALVLVATRLVVARRC